MRKRIGFLSALLLLTLAACGESNLPATETALTTDRPQISAQVELLPEKASLLVTEDLVYSNRQEESLSEIYLYAPPGAFAAENATVQDLSMTSEDATISHTTTGPTFLCITPEIPLAPGDQLRISLQYRLVPPDGNGAFGIVDGAYQLTQFLFAPAHYQASWVLEPPHEFGESAVMEAAAYRVEVTAPPQYQIGASGERLEEKGTIFVSDFARDFALFLSPYHLEKTVEHEGLVLQFYYTEDQTPYLDAWIQSAKQALTFYLEAFGPLDTQSLSLVFSSDRSRNGGRECSDLMFFYFDNLFEEAPASIVQEMDMVIAHELAHQWFYHLLGNDQGLEPFLDEGLATWAETMYLRAQGRFEPTTLDSLAQTFAAGGTQKTPLLRQSVYDFSNPGSYSLEIYYGGASLLYQMEQCLGKENFAKLLRGYVTHFRLGFVTTEEFLAYWQETAGEALEPLFSIYFGA